MRPISIYSKLLLVMVAALLIPSCAVNPVTGKRELALISEEQEIAMGKEYDPQVVATFGEYKDEDLLAFIQQKGTEMGKISHRPDLTYHFRILDSPVVNAFAVPGGYLYFTRGILAQFNNEAELIGVLGHEMGHVTARHTVSQQSKQQLGQLLLLGGMIASEDFRDFAPYAMQGMQLLFLKYSRDAERESDRLGVEYASKLQYDAQQMANFFNVLNRMQSSDGPHGIPSFLSTHPDPGDRYEAVTELSQEWKEKLPGDEWLVKENSYLQMIDGMVYGEDPRQGFEEDDVFYHPEMKFKFPVPSGWMLVNSPSQVQMAPEGGEALMVFTLSDQNSAEAAAEKVLSTLELKTIESERTTVNGMPAVATVSERITQGQQTGQEQHIRVLSYFIEYGGDIYVFHGVTTNDRFTNYLKSFEATFTSFDRLTDASKLNRQPDRIRLRQVKQSGSVSNVLAGLGVANDKLEEVALLNNLELDDQLQAGETIKVIGR
ncbi:MAG: M48 family metalloprotease [Mariniphaga sp.]